MQQQQNENNAQNDKTTDKYFYKML